MMYYFTENFSSSFLSSLSMSKSLATPLSSCDLDKNPISVEIICRAGTNVVGKAWLCWLEMRRDGDVSGDLDEEHVEVVVEVVDEVVEQVVVDVVVVVNVDVDTLGIGTGLSVDDIKDRGGDNLDRTDLVIISPGGRSNFPPNFLRSRKLRNVGSDIFSNGKSKSN